MAKQVDWEAVEKEYRAGIRSLKDIGREFGVSDAGIIKHAKKDGWTRDLSEKIKSKAESLVSAQAVSAEVSAQTKIAEKQIVDANAALLADAVLNQRRDVSRARGVVQKLFLELETELDGLDEFAQLGELMAKPDDNGVDRLNELYRKVISLPSRVDSAKKLADALRVLVELERKVLRIKDDDEGKSSGVTVVLSEQDAGL